MKLVLFAYRDCGYECLNYLISIDKKPLLVVIPKEEDQKEKVFKSVKNLAIRFNVKFIEFEKNNKNLEKEIKSLKPDYAFSCYFPYIIDANILRLFAKYSFNIHGAILPAYKGALSSVWTIINKEQESGSTIHLMTEKVDSGDIIEISKCSIDDKDTGFSLYNKISLISISLFKKYIKLLIEEQEIARLKQLPGAGNYYSRAIPFQGRINWQWSSKEVFNFCRAMYFPPFKSAISIFNGLEYEIDAVEIYNKKSSNSPGEIVDIKDNGIQVATKDLNIFIASESIDMKQFKLQMQENPTKLIFE